MTADDGESGMTTARIEIAENIFLEFSISDTMIHNATGLYLSQIRMLRATFEDAHGKDPATLTATGIKDIVERKQTP